MSTAGWVPWNDEDDYTCAACGSTEATISGEGCWWCEPDKHPEPEEIAAYQQTPEEEAAMIAKGMLYLHTKLAELRFAGEMT
jgi:hypothetical protein